MVMVYFCPAMACVGCSLMLFWITNQERERERERERMNFMENYRLHIRYLSVL